MRQHMINQVVLVGRLTKDPELRYTAEGAAVTTVTLAVARNFRNAEGGIDADFVPCVLWRKTAEHTANYCRKGSMVAVTGRIQTRRYDKKRRSTRLCHRSRRGVRPISPLRKETRMAGARIVVSPYMPFKANPQEKERVPKHSPNGWR